MSWRKLFIKEDKKTEETIDKVIIPENSVIQSNIIDRPPYFIDNDKFKYLIEIGWE